MANASFRNKMYINLCYVLSEEQHFMNIHSDWCFKFITRICSGIDFALILFSFYLTFPPVCVCVCMFGHNRNWNVDAEVCAFSSPVFITVVSRLRCGLYSKSKSPRQTFLSNRFSSLCFFHICYFFLILCKTKRSTGIHETHLPQFSYSFCSSSSGVIRREWPKYFCWCVAGNKKNI